MALEHQQHQLTLAAGGGPFDGGRQPSGDEGNNSSNKTGRLPRWTRQEILVLIEGKRVVESRVRRGHRASGSGQMEPKWASVSSYCKRHGVNRGPVQCRKRWSNLAGDFKKIKDWESRIGDKETESFWVMRNDLRRERRLPGFFDREVYDILDGGGDGGGGGDDGLALALAPVVSGEAEHETEALFDSGRANEGLFSDFEQSGQEEEPGGPSKDVPAPAPVSVAEKQYQSFAQESPTGQGIINQEKQQPGSEAEAEVRSTQEQGKKRKRNNDATEQEDKEEEEEEEEEAEKNTRDRLIDALEKNGNLLGSQLEAQNSHLQLDREQREGHVNSLLSVLNKLADAMSRIADKL